MIPSPDINIWTKIKPWDFWFQNKSISLCHSVPFYMGKDPTLVTFFQYDNTNFEEHDPVIILKKLTVG